MSPYLAAAESSFMVPNGSLAVLGVLLGGALLWLWSLVDVLRTRAPRWSASGQSQVVWVVVLVLLGPLGSVLYLLLARPALARASR